MSEGGLGASPAEYELLLDEIARDEERNVRGDLDNVRRPVVSRRLERADNATSPPRSDARDTRRHGLSLTSLTDFDNLHLKHR